MEALWKYTWNPNGYPLETIILDTSKNMIGDNIELAHTYFRGDSITASCVETGKLTIGSDVILMNQDTHLSELCRVPICRTIQLNTKEAISSCLTINVSFIVDAIDYTLLNQDLHQTANVIHQSLMVKNLNSDTGSIIDLNVNSFTTPSLFSSEEGTEVKSDSLSINKTTLDQSELNFSADSPTIRGNINYIKYDEATQSWVSLNKGTNKESSFVRFLKKPEPNKLTITTRSDLTTIDTLDWIEIDYENKGLIINQLNIKKLIINDKEFSIIDNK